MQLVDGRRVVCLDRRRNTVLDRDAVIEKMGVPPDSIPDYLALVGDSADGIPGVPRWGAKSAAAVLSRYRTLEAIPESEALWDVKVRGARALAANLATSRSDADLYKRLATLRFDVPLEERLEDLEWKGANRDEYAELCEELGFRQLKERPHPMEGLLKRASQSETQGMLWTWRPRRDSNPRAWLRRPALYPLSYGGVPRLSKNDSSTGHSRCNTAQPMQLP